MAFVNAFFSLFITVFIVVLITPAARHIGLLDIPNARKKHKGRVPLIGGIAVFVGFSFGLLISPISLQDYRSFLAASLLLIAIGVLDDLRELSARKKLFAQIIAAIIIVVWGDVVIYSFGDLLFFGNISLGGGAVVFTIFAVVGLINAINMIDGVDGLAGTLVLLQLVLLFFIAIVSNSIVDQYILLLIMGAVIGFLVFNFPIFNNTKRKIFLGDAGSMFLGLVLCWYAIGFSGGAEPLLKPITMLWLLAIPLLDVGSAIIRRLRKGLSPFYADKSHLHHIFYQAGYGPLTTVLIICAMSLSLGIVGILMDFKGVSEGIMFIAFLGLAGLYLVIINHAWKVTKMMKKQKRVQV